jgi:hypothetical protein
LTDCELVLIAFVVTVWSEFEKIVIEFDIPDFKESVSGTDFSVLSVLVIDCDVASTRLLVSCSSTTVFTVPSVA